MFSRWWLATYVKSHKFHASELTRQVDGAPILSLDVDQLRQHARIIKEKSIRSVVVIGVYSPSNSLQEEEAARIVAAELGPSVDISTSSQVGRLGFLERENATILNASLRRFARHVIAGFSCAVKSFGHCKLYITLNDGTLCKASTATKYPVRCFASGPTNSARGAALLAKLEAMDKPDEREVIVVDIGGYVNRPWSLPQVMLIREGQQPIYVL